MFTSPLELKVTLNHTKFLSTSMNIQNKSLPQLYSKQIIKISPIVPVNLITKYLLKSHFDPALCQFWIFEHNQFLPGRKKLQKNSHLCKKTDSKQTGRWKISPAEEAFDVEKETHSNTSPGSVVDAGEGSCQVSETLPVSLFCEKEQAFVEVEYLQSQRVTWQRKDQKENLCGIRKKC